MSNEVKTKEKVNMDPKYIIKLTVTLLLTCMVVAGLLGWVNSITKDKIAAKRPWPLCRRSLRPMTSPTPWS